MRAKNPLCLLLILIATYVLSSSQASAQTTITAGTLTSNTTWTKAASPYIVTNNLMVAGGVSLTLEPGTVVKFEPNVQLIVAGQLVANGNSNDSIYFLRNSATQNWAGITFSVGSVASSISSQYAYQSGSVFNYCAIRNVTSTNGAIYTVNTALYISNSTINQNNANGIRFAYSGMFTNLDKVVIANSKISNNSFNGIQFDAYQLGGHLRIIDNTISNNTLNGVKTDEVGSHVTHTYYIAGNTVIGNGQTGIETSCNGLQTIENNLVYNNGIGIKTRGTGITSSNTSNTFTIQQNRVIGNINYGIQPQYATHNIQKNLVASNGGAIRLNENGTYVISNNNFTGNSHFIDLPSFGSNDAPVDLKYNLVTRHVSYTNSLINVSSVNSAQPDYKINNNKIDFNHNPYIVYNNRSVTNNSINASNTYWGTTVEATIKEKIYDYEDNNQKSLVNITPVRSTIDNSVALFPVRNVIKSVVGSAVELTWSASPESDVTGYKIYYGGFTGYSYANTISLTGTSTVTYTMPAGMGIDEDIAITAIDATSTGTDDQINGYESWYAPANSNPLPPSALVADSAARRIRLSWTPSTSAGVNAYYVYRSTNNNTFTYAGKSSTTSFVDSNLTAHTRYYYRITAFDSLNLSYDNFGLESTATSVVTATPNNVIHVANSGNDSNIGSFASPLKLIETGVNSRAAQGDTIILARGTYYEAIDLKGKISLLTSRFILDQDTSHIGATILNGNQILNTTLIQNTGNSFPSLIHVYALTIDSSRLKIADLESGNYNFTFKMSRCIIRNSGQYAVQFGVITVNSGGVLDSCKIHGLRGRYIIANTSGNVSNAVRPVISNNVMFNNSTAPANAASEDNALIFIGGAGRARVINNLLYRNSISGVHLGLNGSDSMIFVNNTIVLNDGYGIRFFTNGNSYTGILINNIVKYNKQLDISCNDRVNGPAVFLKNNFFGDAGSLDGTGLNSGNNLITENSGNKGGNPYFVDTLNNDFRLLAWSPAVAAGATTNYLLSKDIAGALRINPSRSVPDMGAYESEFKFRSPLFIKTEPENKRNLLFWSQSPSTNITGYQIFRSTSPISDTSTMSFLAQVLTPTIVTYIDSVGVNNGTTYYYRLKSIDNTNALSGFSNQLTARPDSVGPPTALALHNGPTKARISWQGTGVKYQLFRGVNTNSMTLLADSITALIFTDTTLARNTSYMYWVKAMNATGALSLPSSSIQLTPTNIWRVDSASGHDLNGIGSLEAPLKTIGKAVSFTINNDSVYVGNGTYLENINYSNKKITVIGVNGARNVIVKPLLESNIIAMTNGGASYFKGLTFANASSTTAGSVYNGFANSNPTFESCIIRNSGASGGVIHCNGGALNMYNCLVYDNTPNTFFEGSTGGLNVYHTTFVNNSNHFFNSGTNNIVPNFRNCIIWRSTNIVYSGLISVENSIIKGGFPGTTTNLNVSPSFVDSVNKDYRLRNSSQAIGVGVAGLGLARDFNDSVRVNPSGSLPDLGAFETPFKVIAPIMSKTEPGHRKVMLFWTQTPPTNIAGYRIYRSTSSISDSSTLAPIATLSGSGTLTFVDSSTVLQNGTLYYYRVKSFFADSVLSGFSNQLTARPDSVHIPANYVLDNSPRAVQLTWDSIPGGNVKYQIFRSTSTSNPVLLRDSVTSRFLVDSSILRNTVYYYWIRGMNNTGALSEYSSFITLQPTNKWTIDSATGVDLRYRGSSRTPLAKISYAIGMSIIGDTILVKRGTYLDNIQISKRLVIQSSDGPTVTTIKPLLPNSRIVQFISGATTTAFKGFSLINGGNTRGSALYFSFSSPVVSNCIITNCAGEAPIAYYYTGAEIINCLIYRNTAGNNFFYDPNDLTPVISHSTIVYNNGMGTGSSNGVTAPVFRNCIIYGNQGGSYSGNPVIENSIIEGGYPGNTTNIDANPRFIDTSNFNYRLLNYSPAIGLGATLSLTTDDLDGNSRVSPVSSSPDAGCYESQFDHPSPFIFTDSSQNGLVLIKWIQNPLGTVNKFKVYKSLNDSTTQLYDSTGVRYNYTDSANTIFNTILYYKLTSTGNGIMPSGFSNQIRTIAYTPPTLVFPADSAIGVDTIIRLRWNRIPNATRYYLQLSTDSTFTNATQQFTVTDTAYTRSGLPGNTMYYWRVQTRDSVRYSTWSARKKFETFVLPPRLISVNPGNKRDTLTWSNPNSTNIASFRIYRSRDTVNRTLLVSVPGTQLSYIDTNALMLDSTYYYWVTAVNQVGTVSAYSNRLSGKPFNKRPITVGLQNKTFDNVGEFNFVRCVYSMIGSVDPDGQIVSHQWYVNDSLVGIGDTTLIYYYARGTNKLRLITVDNDGAMDTANATIVLRTFTRQFTGGILGGITAVSPSIIYTADSTYSPITGASIFKLDRLGNTTYPLIVSSKIFTTPSVASDSSVFITSGSSLNGFNKAGVSLWPTIPLGGLSYVTPTIDSMHRRIYVGVSNANFLAVNYLTGTVAWSIFCDAPIKNSAVITGDRKLVFVSQSGTLYGFNIVSDSVQTAPRWNQNLGEIISKSGAVDLNNDLYFGTESGKLIKVRLLPNGTVQQLWSVSLGSPVESSPVIDASGYVYAGTNAGTFHRVNTENGQLMWTRQSVGAIKSTPAVTDFGNIVFATMEGNIVAVDSLNNVKWSHKELSPVSANLLYINNIVYVGTQSGSFIGLYDNPATNTVNTSLSYNRLIQLARADNPSLCDIPDEPVKVINIADWGLPAPDVSPVSGTTAEPIWGTFQGNYRRTGSRALDCPDRPSINRSGVSSICTGDSIRLSTSSTGNTTWVYNGVPLNISDTVLFARTAGTYMRMNFFDNGCKKYSDTFTLVVNPVPQRPTVSVNGNLSFCEGGSTQLSSSSLSNNSWYRTGSTSIVSANQTLSITSSGNYFVRVTNSNGCIANSDTLVLTVFARPSVPAVNITRTQFCAGDSAVLSTNSTLQRQWLSSGLPIQNASGTSFVARSAGLYSLRVTDGNGCTNSSANLQVDVNPLPTILVSTSPVNGSVCAGENVTLTATGAATYSWTGGVTNGVAFAPTQSANYVVTGTDANGCVNSAVRFVAVNPRPVLFVSSSLTSNTICAGTAVTLTASGAPTITWTGGIVNGLSFSPNQSGTYTATGTDGNGCVSTPVSVSLTVNPRPAVPSVAANRLQFCAGDSAVLSTSAVLQRQWLNTGLPILNATGATLAVRNAGIYSLRVTDVNGCTNTSDLLQIDVNPLPTISVVSNPASGVVCEGTPITLTAAGAATYSWTGGITNGVSFTPSQSANYMVTGTDANGCVNTAMRFISVNPRPVLSIASTPASGGVCEGSQVVLTASGAATYSWTGGITNGVAFAPTQSGTYVVTGTSANGCTSTGSRAITVHPNPTVQLTNPASTVICEGTAVTLATTATNAASYQWYVNGSPVIGAVVSSFGALSAGSYQVMAISGQGCQSSLTQPLALTLVKTPVADFSFDTYCINTPVRFTNLSQVTGSGTVNWLWNFGDNNTSTLQQPNYTYTQSGIYNISLRVTPQLCPELARTQTRNISVDRPVAATAYPFVKALASVATPLSARNIGVSYLWTPSTGLNNALLANPTFTATQPQNYTIKITAASGCVTTDTLKVFVFDAVDIFVPKAFTPNADGQNDRLYPELVGVTLRYFRVYNRWGQLVYEMRGSTNAGWDGTNNGQRQPMDTYTWHAEGVDRTGQVIKRNGQTLLIR